MGAVHAADAGTGRRRAARARWAGALLLAGGSGASAEVVVPVGPRAEVVSSTFVRPNAAWSTRVGAVAALDGRALHDDGLKARARLMTGPWFDPRPGANPFRVDAIEGDVGLGWRARIGDLTVSGYAGPVWRRTAQIEPAGRTSAFGEIEGLWTPPGGAFVALRARLAGVGARSELGLVAGLPLTWPLPMKIGPDVAFNRLDGGTTETRFGVALSGLLIAGVEVGVSAGWLRESLGRDGVYGSLFLSRRF